MMKVTVLVDNDTLVGINFQGEPALSFYVEEDGKKILFDTGFSDLFLNLTFLGQIPRVLEFENTHSKVITKRQRVGIPLIPEKTVFFCQFV